MAKPLDFGSALFEATQLPDLSTIALAILLTILLCWLGHRGNLAPMVAVRLPL